MDYDVIYHGIRMEKKVAQLVQEKVNRRIYDVVNWTNFNTKHIK